MAHNECDYLEPAKLDDVLNVYTRIEFIKNTSFGFLHIVENSLTKKIIARGGGVLVHIDKTNHTPYQLPKEFYNAVLKFESEVEIIRTT
jgi:acyl-CoA thioesterase FadM